MGQIGNILNSKARNSIPWKHNYPLSKNYAESFFSKNLINKFFHAFLVRGLTYKINFIRLKNFKAFLDKYYRVYKIHEGRRRFSCFPIPGVFLSQVWLNYIGDWVVISVSFFRVQAYSAQKSLLSSLIKLKCYYDSLVEFNFNF